VTSTPTAPGKGTEGTKGAKAKGAAATMPTEDELRPGQEDRADLRAAAEEARRATYKGSTGVEYEPSAKYVDLKKSLMALHLSRKYDAHATFYPIQYSLYNKSTGAYLGEQTCAKGMSTPLDKVCPANWHPCRQAPCRANLLEGHYCMPGPLDSFLRIAYNAIAYPE